MDYGYRITTNGRRVLIACMDQEKPMRITRAAVGSGQIDQDADMATTHELIQYVTEATITDRRHEEDRLFLTVQYSNQDHPTVGAFSLSEIMVWAEDPETGQETDFLYATLGDYRQPVPAYRSGFPASVWSFPMVLVVSSELQVNITASPGLVTFLDLQDAMDRLKLEIMTNEVSLPLKTAAGEALLTGGAAPIAARYRLERSGTVMAAVEAVTGRLAGQISQMGMDARAYAGGQISAAVAAHNADSSAHPTHLAIVTN